MVNLAVYGCSSSSEYLVVELNSKALVQTSYPHSSWHMGGVHLVKVSGTLFR